jgi:hypothetical protein
VVTLAARLVVALAVGDYLGWWSQPPPPLLLHVAREGPALALLQPAQLAVHPPQPLRDGQVRGRCPAALASPATAAAAAATTGATSGSSRRRRPHTIARGCCGSGGP